MNDEKIIKYEGWDVIQNCASCEIMQTHQNQDLLILSKVVSHLSVKVFISDLILSDDGDLLTSFAAWMLILSTRSSLDFIAFNFT